MKAIQDSKTESNTKEITPSTTLAAIRRRRMPLHTKYATAARYIEAQESVLGGFFFHTKQSEGAAAQYESWLCAATADSARQLYQLTRNGKIDPSFGAHLVQTYGLARTESFTQHVVAHLEGIAAAGPERRVAAYASYERDTQRVYISQRNGMVWILNGATIEAEPNGKNVCFTDADHAVPCPAVEIAPHELLARTLIDDVAFDADDEEGFEDEGEDKAVEEQRRRTDAAQRLLLLAWMHAPAFMTPDAPRPILLLAGPTQAGKTLAVARIQMALFGTAAPLPPPSDERSFCAHLATTPIACIDNLDTGGGAYAPWLPNFLATFTTSGVIQLRTLYTTLASTEIHLPTLCAITSRDPQILRRPDLASRTITLRLKKRNCCAAEAELFQTIKQLRPKLLGEWIWRTNEILRQLPTTPVPHNTDRLTAFYHLVATVARVYGYTEETVTDAILVRQTAQKILVAEGDPLIDLLELLIATKKDRTWTGTGRDLFCQLQNISQVSNIPLYTKTPHGLSIQLREKWDVLGSRIRCRKRRAHRSTTEYTFSY